MDTEHISISTSIRTTNIQLINRWIYTGYSSSNRRSSTIWRNSITIIIMISLKISTSTSISGDEDRRTYTVGPLATVEIGVLCISIEPFRIRKKKKTIAKPSSFESNSENRWLEGTVAVLAIKGIQALRSCTVTLSSRALPDQWIVCDIDDGQIKEVGAIAEPSLFQKTELNHDILKYNHVDEHEAYRSISSEHSK